MLKNLSQQKSFGGWHKQYTHPSNTLNCDMRFAIYLPPTASEENKVPVLYWLSGLTCTDENFMQKAGAHRMAAALGIAIVAPDTSPRGANVPDDENGAYDFGLGAGFYLNATQAPWNAHYQMRDYILDELPALIEAHFPVNKTKSISGHSMGGHGALTLGLSNPERYCAISAFSPITNPANVPWGIKAFSHYLGENKSDWLAYDACALIQNAATQHQATQSKTIKLPILIDQGDSDTFLDTELTPSAFIEAAKKANYPITFRMQQGYDHSYYFIASFIDEHLNFHAKHLHAACI